MEDLPGNGSEPLSGKVARTYHEFAKRKRYFGTYDKSVYDGPLDTHLLISPSKVIENVESPPVVPLRFTYNGKMMIAAMDQSNQLIIYNYKGVNSLAGVVPDKMFYTIFEPKHIINLEEPGRDYRFHKDGVFLMEDDDFLITFLSCPVFNPSDHQPGVVPILPYGAAQKNNEAVKQVVDKIEYYVLQIVSLETGKVVDKISLDYTWLVVPHCVYLRKRTLVVLAIHDQLIHIYNISKDGHPEKIAEIGEFLEPMDQRLHTTQRLDKTYTGMRQLLMMSLYNYHKSQDSIKQFFELSDLYRSLKMIRIQLIEDNVLLIRWTPAEVVRQEAVPQAPSGPIYFTFYDWRKKEILGIYGQSSLTLLKLYETYQETFRYGFLTKNKRPITMEYHAEPRRSHETFKKNFRSKYPSEHDLSRKLLSQLPCSMSICPAFSPFLDPAMFNFDEKIIAAIERGRVPVDMKIRTFNRLTGKEHINISLEHLRPTDVPPVFNNMSINCCVLFHPYDAFIVAFLKRPSQIDTSFTFFIPEFRPPEDLIKDSITRELKFS